jgi:hypothetical protein
MKVRSINKKGERSQQLFTRSISKLLDSREAEFDKDNGIEIRSMLIVGRKTKRSSSKTSAKAQLA